MAIEVRSDSAVRLFTFVHGTRVMIAEPYSFHRPGGHYHYRIRTFDFSQRGRGSPLLRGGVDGTGGRVRFEDGANVRFEPGGGIGPWGGLRSLGDGILIRLVSCLAHYAGSEVVG